MDTFMAECLVRPCGWSETWTTQAAAQSAAVWHAFDNHREVWTEITGKDFPQDQKPDTLGMKVMLL